MIWLLFLLLTKHLIIDFPLQGPYQYRNKGTFGHPGGILHAGLHAAATVVILLFFAPVFWWLGLIEGAAHYLIDWAKVNTNRKLSWGPTTHEEFWWLVGFDQWLHQLCYLAITALVFSGGV